MNSFFVSYNFQIFSQFKLFGLLILPFEKFEVVHDRLVVSVCAAALARDPGKEQDQENKVESERNIANVQLGIFGIVKEVVIITILGLLAHRFNVAFKSCINWISYYIVNVCSNRIQQLTRRSCCIGFRAPDEVDSLARFLVAQASIVVTDDSKGREMLRIVVRLLLRLTVPIYAALEAKEEVVVH